MCESVNHWAPGWFHKVKSSNDTWLSYEVILLQAGFDHPSELKGLLSECWNAAVFESSTSKTVCGRVWLDSYIESLFEGQKANIVFSPALTSTALMMGKPLRPHRRPKYLQKLVAIRY